jgi:guanylate kinase
LARVAEYNYQVLNDDLDRAVAQIRELVRQQFERAEHAG